MARYWSENITAALNFAKELLVGPDWVQLQTHGVYEVWMDKQNT